MAKPIKETPVLEGKDAQRFAKDVDTVKPESKETVKRAKATYEAVMKQVDFRL